MPNFAAVRGLLTFRRALVLLCAVGTAALGAAAWWLLPAMLQEDPAAAAPLAEVDHPPAPPEAAPAAPTGAAPTFRTEADQVPPEGLSWPAAEQAFGARRWADALKMYSALLAQSERTAENRNVSDYLRLRTAMCLRRLDRQADARRMLLDTAAGPSPILRATACRELALADLAGGQPLLARMRACQAVAALGAVSGQAALETDCEFLAAQALTQKAAAIFGAEILVSRPAAAEADPFQGLGEADLRRLLDEGTARLASAALGPSIRPDESAGAARRWTAVSSGAPLEEFLSRLTLETSIDIRWESVDPPARRRTVTLCLAGATDQRLVEVACGTAGLVARFTGNEAVVCDPATCPTTASHQDLLVREAVSAWRRFFLRATEDGRLAAGRFALGQIHERSGDGGAAITEYRVLAERFPSDRLAALARLRVAVIRLDLRDYAGARQELLDLLDRYPDCPAIDEVYLRLGQATMEAGRLDDALQIFKKLYYLDLSASSRAGAALGAAACHFRQGRRDEVARWLTHRINLARAPDEPGLAEAYGLLAKTEAARGRFSHAIDAYKKALGAAGKAGPPGGSAAWRVEMLLELAQILAQQEDFVAALGILEHLSPKDATPAQADALLLARADLLRAMHLPEQAMTALRRGQPAAASPEAASRMKVLEAECLADAGDVDQARTVLAEALGRIAPGPTAHRAALTLADLSLRAGRAPHAVTVCRDLLGSGCTDDVRRSALQILGAAYAREKDYERAAMALAGKVPDEQGTGEP